MFYNITEDNFNNTNMPKIQTNSNNDTVDF